MHLSGTVTIAQVTHPSLVGNALYDSPVRSIPIYTPPGYDGGRRYPVVYYLPGYTGSSLSPLNVAAFEPNLVERFDRLIVRGIVPPALLVVADGFTRLGGSQYLNSTLNGRYEDAVAGDLVDWVDRQYPTIAAPEGRAIIGKSSGGYGALVIGMRHPDRFSIVVSHSGDCYFEYCYLPDLAKSVVPIARRGGVAGFRGWFEEQDHPGGDAFTPVSMIAMAAAYSPNPAAPGGVDLPVDLDTGEILPEVWNRWLALDPVRLVDRHADALRGMNLVWIDCGTRDEYALHLGARILVQRLRASGVAVVHEEFDGGHNGITYRAEQSFRAIGAAFDQFR